MLEVDTNAGFELHPEEKFISNEVQVFHRHPSFNIAGDDDEMHLFPFRAKEWGLKTKESIFRIVFNSGTAISVAAATIGAISAGAHVSITLPLGVGSIFLVDNISLEVGSFKRSLHRFKQEDPITYLIDIKTGSYNGG